MKQPTLLLIDGFNLLSRGYFATAYGKDESQLSRNEDGLYTNALRVFFQKLFQLLPAYDVTHAAIAWDVKREDTIRRQEFEFYKATRGDLPEALIQQYETSTVILDKLGIHQLIVPPYEADDAIGALSRKWGASTGRPCFIYSNDRDLLQLLDKQTTQIIAGKKGDHVYDLVQFQEEYGITPSQWVDVKALLGDKSDNIPGCPGVGEKSALPLIQQYGTVEALYEEFETLDAKFNRYRKKLLEGKETTFISKKLAQIIFDIPEIAQLELNDLQLPFSQDEAIDLLSQFGLRIKYEPVQEQLKLL
ncbi:5'-3' exonuclease [Halalkalibacterium ligniniphilum]|uniref:5'-3' exonuclease n=1 Tax=Halalkalibacterium ligniniphilum TaxID=1134413 RepID=UPI00034DB4B4|nr:5'-3' exonuclease H3TH domain-containing protein [Halalkalibacterium ligniniphilum]